MEGRRLKIRPKISDAIHGHGSLRSENAGNSEQRRQSTTICRTFFKGQRTLKGRPVQSNESSVSRTTGDEETTRSVVSRFHGDDDELVPSSVDCEVNEPAMDSTPKFANIACFSNDFDQRRICARHSCRSGRRSSAASILSSLMMVALVVASALLVVDVTIGVATAVELGNNLPPKFVLPEGESEIVLRLKEGSDSPAGARIYRLKGLDPEGDQLQFGIRGQIGNNLLELRQVSANEADIFLKQALDRETADEYNIVLTLSDGNFGNVISQSMLILVEDVNDNAPVFEPHPSTVSVPENSSPTVLAHFRATDQDEGLFGQVLFRLGPSDGGDDVFSVTNSGGEGVLSLVGQLDYETQSVYQVRIIATDRSSSGQPNSATAVILVRVEDVEDRPPEFVAAPPVTRIPEDTPPGKPVLQVKAVDGDRGVDNRIQYFLVAGPEGVFTVNVDTGVVATARKLDREGTDSDGGAYILQIEAREVPKPKDQLGFLAPPPMSVKTEVTIIVTDVNDEQPTFRSSSYELIVDENSQANTPLTFVGSAVPEVFDHDQGLNGTFRLRLSGENGMFDVTPERGINEASFLIRVKDPTNLDYEKIKELKFTIIAEEEAPPRRATTADVSVTIRDANDHIPEFNRPVYEVSIPENVKEGTTVAWIQASDPDSGDFGSAGIRYTDLRGSLADVLNLDPMTGVITMKTSNHSLDREQIFSFYLLVEARDNRGLGNRNTVQVHVKLEDVNDERPTFLQPLYEAQIPENTPRFRTKLAPEAVDLDLAGTNNSAILYAIVGGDPLRNFTMDPKTGEISPRVPLDFETAPGDGEQKYFNLTIQARDKGEPTLFGHATVIIYVLDENDHAPVFARQFIELNIPEDTPGGTSLLTVHADDGDGTVLNSRIAYRIEEGPIEKFILDPTSGMLRLANGASLDPDQTDPPTYTYSLKIVAVDSGLGTTQMQDSSVVNITIADVNNKPPQLAAMPPVSILESAGAGYYVRKVAAHDPDSSASLIFAINPNLCEGRNELGAIVKRDDYNYTSAFELGIRDGILRLTRPLDREKVASIKLAVTVIDTKAVQGLQQDTGFLQIFIEDINDNAPIFRKQFYYGTVQENAKRGHLILSVVADDADVNRTIHYSIDGYRSVTNLLFLDPESGQLVVQGKIDREEFSWLNFSVRATDNGRPPRSTIAMVMLQVLDENDNNPVFRGAVTNVTIPEDAQPGTQIMVVEAFDADEGENGRITYLLNRQSAEGKFRIDPVTGAITVSGKLDREAKDFYTLVVEAWDNFQLGYSTGESRNAFKQIGIEILDVNDEPPIFVQPAPPTSRGRSGENGDEPSQNGCSTITEFHPPGDTVGLISVRDADDINTPNAWVTFSIQAGDDEGLFHVENTDFQSGRLISTRPLVGRFGNYNLTIRATDRGYPPIYTSTIMEVCVMDFNDHSPVFISPPNNSTFRVPENATVGSIIAKVMATDNDIGRNGQVRFGMKRDPLNHWKAFSIDPISGIITLAQALDRERQKFYQLRIEARDMGLPTPLSSDLDLSVYVKNVDDMKPKFVPNTQMLNFTEHLPPGKERRLVLEAIDEDDEDFEYDEDQRTLCYFIVGGNQGGFFTIDPASRTLMAIKELDRESRDTHVLLVRATDSCVVPPTNISFYDPNDPSLLNVTIYVNDVNDNPPRFIKRIFTGGVSTDADFGLEFLELTAVDLDYGANADLTYAIVPPIRETLSEGLENLRGPPFLVDPKNGVLQLNFDPQPGMKGYFDFEVTVNDTGGLWDKSRVFIYLLREDQRVRFLLRLTPGELRGRLEAFRDTLSNTTDSIVNVDEIRVHEGRGGLVDRTKTDLYVHLVNRSDHSILPVNRVLSLIDSNVERLDQLFKDYNVIDSAASKPSAVLEAGPGEQLLVLYLGGASAILAFLLAIVIAACLHQRSKFKRQLKAATATAFGSHDSGLNRPSPNHVVPNTNVHSVEGSNPVWMTSYDNDWYKNQTEDESTPGTHSGPEGATGEDSLDENAVLAAMEDTSTIYNPEPYDGELSSKGRSSVMSKGTLVSHGAFSTGTTSNNLNRTYKHNLYTAFEKMHNPLLAQQKYCEPTTDL